MPLTQLDKLAGPELFRQLLDAAPDAVIVIDASGRILLVNQQTERMFGHTREELIGQPIEVLMPARFRGGHVAHRMRFTSAPTVRPMGIGMELFGLRRDGAEISIEISLSPMTTTSGMLVLAGMRDITERKRLEATTRRAQAHLLGAVESVQGGFAIFDEAGGLVMCNSACRGLLGQPVIGEITGRTFEDLMDVNLAAGAFDLGERSEAEFRDACARYHRQPSGVLPVRTRDGHALRFVERRTGEGGTVVTISDVSDDVAREDELRRAHALAEAANAAKSEFLSSMSHELRTPLNAILGFAQLLVRDKKTPLSERHRERVDYVLKGGEHLLHLIDDVLDLSRIESGQVPISLEPVRLADVLPEVKETLDPMAARADIRITIDPGEAAVTDLVADRTRLKQVLMNFGSNAIKYGRAGGSVAIRAVNLGAAARVTVSDDGIGIPVEKHSKIFEPFQRAGQETGPIQGTGIGLAISKRLAGLMRGHVGFDSVEGVGSTFWIELPLHEVPLAEAPDAATSARGLAGADQAFRPRGTVVYVEDNPSNIAFMQALLGDYDGIELLSVPTAEIGLELIRSRRPNLVIMDINLPGMSGFEATARLKEWPETRGIPVIALSAAAMARDLERMREAGFHRYLTKPVKVDELAAALEDILTPGSSQGS